MSASQVIHTRETNNWRSGVTILIICSQLLTKEYPTIEENLEEVVGEHGVLEVEWLPALHDEGPQHPDHQEVGQADEQGGGGAGHQQPVLTTGLNRGKL